MQEYRNEPMRTQYKGAVVRRRKKKNSANLYLTVSTGIIAALGSLLSVNVFFNLNSDKIQINGSTLYPPEQIASVGGVFAGQNLIRLNTDFVGERISDHLVYVDDIEVVKDYPNGLIINITEAVPQSQIEQDGSLYTVSQSGRLLEVNQSERNEKLPLVVGFELKQAIAGQPAFSADEQKTDILVSIFEKLGELDFQKIHKIDISDRTDIRLYYDDRLEIELGSSVDLDIKLRSIKAVIDSKLPKGYEGILRYNGIDSGTSAIPKEPEVSRAPVGTTSSGDSSGDSSSDTSVYNPDGIGEQNGYWDENGNWVDNSWSNGYWDENGNWVDNSWSSGYYDENGYWVDNSWSNGYYDENGYWVDNYGY